MSPARFGGFTDAIKEVWRKDYEPDDSWMLAIVYWSPESDGDGQVKLVTFFRLAPWTTATARERLHHETLAIDLFKVCCIIWCKSSLGHFVGCQVWQCPWQDLRNAQWLEILPPGPERELGLQLLVPESTPIVLVWFSLVDPGIDCFLGFFDSCSMWFGVLNRASVRTTVAATYDDVLWWGSSIEHFLCWISSALMSGSLPMLDEQLTWFVLTFSFHPNAGGTACSWGIRREKNPRQLTECGYYCAWFGLIASW